MTLETNTDITTTDKLTVEHTLQQAIAQHQAGRLQEAEELFLAILQAHPNHPEANHRMGVLAVQMKQAAASLPYFMAALDAAPECAQYWLSAIDGLFQADQLEAAREVLAIALQQGLQGDEVDTMAARLKTDMPIPEQPDAKYQNAFGEAKPVPSAAAQNNTPSPEEINTLLALFNERRYTEAATLAQAMTERFPLYGFGWKALGTLLSQIGRNADALIPLQKAATLSPDDAEVHNNLGFILMNLDRLDEAEVCYQRALEIRPDFAEADHNLKEELQDKKFAAAVKNYRDALSLKPDLAKAHNNLGIVFQNNGLGVSLQRTIDYAFYPRVPTISLELTNNCNLKCPYCANVTLTRPKTYIDWALLEKIIDECAEKQYDLAWLHGVGEPLLWDRLEEVIALIKRKGAGTGSFATNGTLLRPDRVKRLLDSGLDSIYVSIDTLDPEVYKNTRGGKLEKVIHNVQEMIKIVPSSFQITVALMNHKDYRLTEETVRQFHQIFGYHDNVRTNLVQNSLFPSAPGDYRVGGDQKIQSCLAPSNYLFIALDGRAAICCLDQDVLHSLGNVAERSICDVWFDPNNQTTFRNVALGVHECPDACTQKCVLLPPRQNINAVNLGFGVSFDDAVRFIDILLQNNDKRIVLPIVRDLIQRDPVNPYLHAILKEL